MVRASCIARAGRVSRTRAFLGRPEGADTRDLQLTDARIQSISRAGDMAVLFGPQNIQQTFGTRTLARVAMAGGARRDLLTNVVAADWIPGSDALAVIRDPGGGRPWTVEFPSGTTVHEAPAAWSLRVSPDGSRVAFFEGPLLFDSAPEAMITVIDKTGRKSTIAKDLTGYGLAWTPSGNEVWFTATRPGQHAPQVLAASLSGVERAVHRAPDWLVLHDISAAGRVLLSRNTIRINMACKPAAEARERDLTWLMASTIMGLSPDGETVIFADPLATTTPANPPIFRRGMDGSPAVPIGEGAGATLSPDGKWVLASSGSDLVLWPMGAGAMVRLPKGDVVGHGNGRWLGDSKRIVFTGETGRQQAESLSSGDPGRRSSRDYAGRSGPRRQGRGARRPLHPRSRWRRPGRLFPIQGGDGQDVPALRPGDIPLQWSQDGRYVYTVDVPGEAKPPAAEVFRVELATGARVLWKTLSPSDPVGVEHMRGAVAITPDAQAYCYSYMRRLGDLFVVDGLK